MPTFQPMLLRPHVTSAVWGGSRLTENYNIKASGLANAAEAWVLSAHPKGSSAVVTGPFAGKTLGQLFQEQPELFGTKCAGGNAFSAQDHFPVLVKLIDAQENLSIQVHPRDGDAALRPGEAGKTECWLILEAAPGAQLYLGFREPITPAQFAAAIAENAIMDYVQPFAVRPGDFFFIPAGTLHAIGKGVLLAEVQQSSDTTYRVYDYNRLQNGLPRELHIEQAKAVTDLTPYEHIQPLPGEKNLCACEYFTAEQHDTSTGFSLDAGAESFLHLLVLEAGHAELEWNDLKMPLVKGSSVLVPAGARKCSVTGKARVLVTSI